MKNGFRRLVCGSLIATSVLMPYAAQTQAAMIGSAQAIAASADAQRDTVSRFVSRADVQRQLAAYGVANAGERVAALTDDEARELAGKIDRLPAGADSGVTFLLIIALILLIFVIVDWRK